jgi:hypothetical protein
MRENDRGRWRSKFDYLPELLSGRALRIYRRRLQIAIAERRRHTNVIRAPMSPEPNALASWPSKFMQP